MILFNTGTAKQFLARGGGDGENRGVREAAATTALKLPHPEVLLTLGGCFGLLFLTTRFRDRALGLALVFALFRLHEQRRLTKEIHS